MALKTPLLTPQQHEQSTATAAAVEGEAGFLKASAFLYGALYLFVLFQFASGFLIAKFLGPALYGLKAAFDLAIQYEPFTQLGTHEAMQKEVPFHRGRGDPESADDILANVFSVNLLYSVGLCLALFAGALYLSYARFDQIFVDFLLFLGIFTILNRLNNFYAAQLVIDKRTYLLSQLRVLHGFAAASASVVLVYFFSLRGLFVALLAANVIALVFVLARLRWVPPLRFSLPLTGKLIRIGFPIMILGLMFVLFVSVDKLLILSLLPREMLGYFAVAALISLFIFQTLGEVIRVMFFPRLMEVFGRSGDPRQLKDYLTEPTLLLACLVPILLGALFLGVHLPIRYLAPEYIPAIGVAKVLMLGYYFFAVMSMPILVAVALNRQTAIVMLTALAIALNAALNYAFIHAGWGISGVALGTGISYFGYCAVVLAFAHRLVGGELGELLRLSGLILVPFSYMVGLLLALDRWLPVWHLGFWDDVAVTAMKFGIYCLLFALVPFGMRKHPAFVRLVQGLLGLRSKVQSAPLASGACSSIEQQQA